MFGNVIRFGVVSELERLSIRWNVIGEVSKIFSLFSFPFSVSFSFSMCTLICVNEWIAC